ncbi:GroES-like protein [Punctularia strigosozonata HHB-11173 SS5]|uniref:GroES-like protein n=1 Tax=Punctularia strigosozonata (strain HHB-11173) TaxID=741275 RepID=UPI00044176DD|nr:GroES-like protein [Punctularia strigosozonata HHB-11173 SS5]EIN14336.1 GroES-like protein [Punctularia strigosozonata HHB-11173 SS5]
MKAICMRSSGGSEVLELADVAIPALQSEFDVLVRLKACALNPVDTKIRRGAFASNPILGFDAAGIVEEASLSAKFRPGDEVMFSGALGRAGSNAQFTVVDSRVVSLKPREWDWAESAALPLAALTAWEMLEENFNLKPFSRPKRDETLIIVNGAGGVGSIATQLARNVFGIQNVVVTASRDESVEWSKKMGATHVINHHNLLGPQLKRLGLVPSLAFICYDTPKYVQQLTAVMRPRGRIGSIVECDKPLGFESVEAFSRALSFHWEFMFCKAVSGFDVESQGSMLAQLKEAIERGLIHSIVGERKTLSAPC